jgi:transposase
MSKLSPDLTRVTRVGLDLAKHVFQIHAVDAAGAAIDKRQVRRAKLLDYFAALPPCIIGMEACSSAHHWARELEALGHTAMLIPPIYVKPFVKRQKNDATDAAAICEAMGRPDMRCVPVRSVENQATKMVHGVRETLSGQRTQLLNALRGHLAEIGVIAPQGHQHGRKLATLVEDASSLLPECVIAALLPLVERLRDIEVALDEIDRQIADQAKANADARLLMTIPGVGPLKASAIVATLGDKGIGQFSGAKNFAAWLGLTPGQHGTGGKPRLERITKMGDRYLRKLFVVGAHTVLIHADKHDDRMRQWAKKLRSTKKIKLAAVALANKTARIVYAVLATQTPYAA